MGFFTNYYSYYHIIVWKRNGLIRHYSMYYLSFEFLEEDFEYIIFLRFDFPHAFDQINIKALTEALEAIYQKDQNLFIVLTPEKEQPLYKESPDEFIYSFSCNFHHFKKIIGSDNGSEFADQYLLFKLLDQILNGNSEFKKILVRQIPIQTEEILQQKDYAVIIPHRGDNGFLRNLLSFLNELTPVQVQVGLDQEITEEEIINFKHDYPNVSFYSFNPHPAGPYVIRNRLIEECNHELLFFQDSDDIPCADRFERISDFMIRNECQLCGSNEVKLDYFDRTVRAYRYPKNVINSLKSGPGHSLLHPTSAITKKAFYLCGKLSEERIFGNDTKFLYRSFFSLTNIQNINEFLYIRRIHSGSLSTSEATRIGSPIRYDLLCKWVTDFERVKSGQLRLEDSSLNYESPTLTYTMKKL